VADHNAITEKLDQMSLNFRKRLSAVLRIDVVLADSGKPFIGVYDINGLGVVHKSVKDGFNLVINNRDAAEDLADVRLYYFAVNSDFFGEEPIVWADWLHDFV
jgi:hypothetical protein